MSKRLGGIKERLQIQNLFMAFERVPRCIHSRDQIPRHARGQGNVHFPCSADNEQDWQPYPVDPYSAICDDHTYIHTYR